MRFDDVLAARDLLAGHLPPTPMWAYPGLDRMAGATVLVKHENVQPTGAFKVRGGLTYVAGLGPAERERGLVTYSTGNHAQSMAYASAACGVTCTVVMPENAPENKVRAVSLRGAAVVRGGADMTGAQAYAERLATETGAVLVSPGDAPGLIAGVATTFLEILTAEPDLDALLVPVGSGTGAGAACVVAAELAPRCRVIGVQSELSPAAYESWRTGSCVRAPDRTRIEGLATGRGFSAPQRLMRGLAGFRLVSDAAIGAAQRVLAHEAHTLAEGAGAAALAAVLESPDDFAGQRVAVVCSGGNASPGEIAGLP